MQKSDFVEYKNYLIKFLKQPLTEINSLPDWPWEKLLVFQIIVTGSCGAISAVLEKSFLGILGRVIMTPISSLIVIGATTFLFFYLLQIVFQLVVTFKNLYTLILFSSIPFFILQILSSLVSPIILISLAFTALLLIKGITETYKLPKKVILKLVGGFYLALILMWLWGKFEATRGDKYVRTLQIEAPEVKLGE